LIDGWSKPRLLDSEDNTSGFTCGDEELDAWLHRHALMNERSGMSRTYVSKSGGDIAGFYALSTGGISHEEAADRLKKGVPRHAIPVIILTRMGVDLREQGKGLGAGLLTDACRRVAAMSEDIGIRALLIHAKNEDAKSFYMNFAEFEESPTDRNHLSLLIKDLRLTIN